jgi:hypothetical protein
MVIPAASPMIVVQRYSFAEPACFAFAQWLQANPECRDDDELSEVTHEFAEQGAPYWYSDIDATFVEYPDLMRSLLDDPDLTGEEDLSELYHVLAAHIEDAIYSELLGLVDQRLEGAL